MWQNLSNAIFMYKYSKNSLGDYLLGEPWFFFRISIANCGQIAEVKCLCSLRHKGDELPEGEQIEICLLFQS